MYAFEWFKGILFENGRRYAKSDNTIQKGLKERIQKHIQHVQIEGKISVRQSNLLYPLYGVYVHNYHRRQKMPKRVKMLTSKWHKKEENFFTHHFRSLKCSRLAENIFFCCEQWGKRGGGCLRLCPLLGPHDILTGPNWHNAQLDHVFYKIIP